MTPNSILPGSICSSSSYPAFTSSTFSSFSFDSVVLASVFSEDAISDCDFTASKAESGETVASGSEASTGCSSFGLNLAAMAD